MCGGIVCAHGAQGYGRDGCRSLIPAAREIPDAAYPHPMRGARESVEGLPCDPARVRDPVLVGSRVTARLLVFLDHVRIGRLELRAHAAQFLIGIYLETQMVDTGGLRWRSCREDPPAATWRSRI